MLRNGGYEHRAASVHPQRQKMHVMAQFIPYTIDQAYSNGSTSLQKTNPIIIVVIVTTAITSAIVCRRTTC